MRSPALIRRHRQSAIVSRMILTCLSAMMGDFERESVSAAVPELAVGMVIRLNDEDNKPPISISKITEKTGISRKTVGRHVERLADRGVVIRNGDGVTGNDAYLETRMEADYFRAMLRAIIDAADQLRALE